MQQYIKYFKYVLKHKWYVMLECFNEKLYWQGIIHDSSKFYLDEFIPYANFFYKSKGDNISKGRNKTGYYKPTDTGDKAFDFAWLLHQKRNKHYWQWWILPEDNGGVKILEMSDKYLREMICDWVGAGKAQGHFPLVNDKYSETKQWYSENKNKMQLHPNTRKRIEKIIQYKHDKN